MSDQDKFLLYTAPNGAVKVDVFFKDETVWLTQKDLAELFGVQRPAITKHLGNIFSTGELVEKAVCSILEHTAADGKIYSAKYYTLATIRDSLLPELSGELRVMENPMANAEALCRSA